MSNNYETYKNSNEEEKLPDTCHSSHGLKFFGMLLRNKSMMGKHRVIEGKNLNLTNN